MSQSKGGGIFVAYLEEAFISLFREGFVGIEISDESASAKGSVRLVPKKPDAPSLELRIDGEVADFFVGDLDAVELDASNETDREEFMSLARALAEGEVDVVASRSFRGWKARKLVWPSGEWSHSGWSLLPVRKDRLPSYR